MNENIRLGLNVGVRADAVARGNVISAVFLFFSKRSQELPETCTAKGRSTDTLRVIRIENTGTTGMSDVWVHMPLPVHI